MTEKHQRIVDRYSKLIDQPYEERPTGIQNECRNIGELIFISLLEEFEQPIKDKKGRPLTFGDLSSKVQAKTPVVFPSNVSTAFGTVWKLGNDGSHAQNTDATVQEAEAILNALYTCVEWYLYTHHKLKADKISIDLPGKAREVRKNIADYRTQVIAALEDNQVSLDELNMLNRLQTDIPFDTIQTIHSEFGLEQGIVAYLEVFFQTKRTNNSRLRSVKLLEVLSEEDLTLLTKYIPRENILEILKKTTSKSTPRPVPTPIRDSVTPSGQSFTNLIFNGLIWMMVIAIVEIGGGYYFNTPITDKILFPISLELTLILVAWYHIRSHQHSDLTRKTLAYLLGGAWLVIGSVGIFVVYSWDDIQPHLEREVTASLSESTMYFYSLNGNVLEVSEHDLVEAIRLTPNADHMVFNEQTEQWNSWDSYPNIVKAVKQQ